tara:strand:- start:186 stop:980 length:795 start_codon:yes stop_codon:yes gene_type:complete
MDKITNLKEVIKNSLRELMAKEQEINEKADADPCLCKKDSDCKGAKEAGCYGETCFNNRCSKVEKNKNKATTTISKKMKIKEAAFNMLNEACTCLTANTGPGANTQPFTEVYNTCASSQGNAVTPVQSTWCCTHMIHPQDVCDSNCLDSNNPCFGVVDPVLPTGGKPFGQLPADISSLTKDTRTRGVKPSMDRDFMSRDRMLNEAPTCEERGFSNCPFGSTCMGEPCRCQIPGRGNRTFGTWGCEKGCDCPPPAGFTTDLMKKN